MTQINVTKKRNKAHQSFKFAAALIAMLCLTIKVWADDGATITNYINGLHPTGDIRATFNPGYNTVTRQYQRTAAGLHQSKTTHRRLHKSGLHPRRQLVVRQSRRSCGICIR